MVVFPLFHLYRRASVKRQYLKGNDSVLYDALEDHFDISVDTVIYYDEDHGNASCIAYRYGSDRPVPDTKKEESFEDQPGFEEEINSEDEFAYRYHVIGKVMKLVSFHVPRSSVVDKVWKQRLAWLGNEWQRVETRYYGAGMFVKPKNKGGCSEHVCERSDLDGR
jgi:hypothetical protein